MNRIKAFLCLVILLITQPAFAYTPPTGTPLGDEVHPRIWLIPEGSSYSNFGIKVSDITTRIAANASYKTMYQAWVTTMDGYYSTSTTGATVIDATTCAIGFAFLHQTDPANISGISATYTKAQYGAKAIEWGTYIANEMIANTGDDWFDYSATYYNGDDSGPRNMSLAIVADWVSSLMTVDDRQLFLDATLEALENMSEIDTLSTGAHWSGLQNGMAALGMYGDTVDDGGSGTTYATHMSTLIDLFNTNWLEGTDELSELFFDGGSTDFQGVEYYQLKMRFGTNMFLAMSSLMNHNYYETMSFLKYLPNQYLYKTDPIQESGNYKWFLSGDINPSSRYVSSHYGQDNIFLNATMFALNDNYADLAGVLKWSVDNRVRYTDNDSIESDYVLANLLFSPYMKDIISVTPTTSIFSPSVHLGKGRYIFKSDFNSTDETSIIFNAPPYHTNDGGHASREFGHFMIAKYGLATGRRNNSKSAGWNGDYLDTQLSFFYNTMAVSSGSSDPLAEFKSGYDDHTINPDSTIWGSGGANYLGTHSADISSSNYDYVDYKYTEAWDQSKVDYAEREFVYLRSAGGTDDEYVVVFDRISSVDAGYDKYFLLGVPFTSKLLDNSGSEISMTTEDCSGDLTPGGRWVNTSSSPIADNIIELTNTWGDVSNHSKLYNKTLWPASFQINKQGGDDHSHEDLNCDPVTWPDSYPVPDYEKNYFGSYVMQIQSTTNQQYDYFLNVMQIGNNNTLSSMVATDRITSTDMSGVHIKDTTQNRIIMFCDEKNDHVDEATAYTITTTAASTHILAGLEPLTQYDLDINGTETTPSTNSAGVLSFDSAVVGSLTVSLDGGTPLTATCSDGVQNGDETGVDCGGSCDACESEPTPGTTYNFGWKIDGE